MKTAISTEKEYKSAMRQIELLMNKGSENVTPQELDEIRRLALQAQRFEKQHFDIRQPTTLAGVIEMKMYELRLNQTEVAKKLNISSTKLSLILNGKQKPDVAFLKMVHENLAIDANLLLEVV
jgi:HTH-type transcriptional regulator / antitoxin HigA